MGSLHILQPEEFLFLLYSQVQRKKLACGKAVLQLMEACETATSQCVITKQWHVLGWELYLSGTTVVCKTYLLVVFDKQLDQVVEQVTEEA